MSAIYSIGQAGVLFGPIVLPVIPGIGSQMPDNAVELPAELAAPADGYVWTLVNGAAAQCEDNRGTVYSTTTALPELHTALGALPDGLTKLAPPSPDYSWSGFEWAFDEVLRAKNMTALCSQLGAAIDAAADTARLSVVGDALRAVEYQAAATEARAFQAAGYPSDAVPEMVSAWAIAGRTAEQAAIEIIKEADLYTQGLAKIRTSRLAAKEHVRVLLVEDSIDEAEGFTAQIVAAIVGSVNGMGYNAPEAAIPVKTPVPEPVPLPQPDEPEPVEPEPEPEPEPASESPGATTPEESVPDESEEVEK
ncbi:hypothetical protein [Pseudomonas gingeri]|uniref:hypothetical protein n=1 Tax=Pseudomonas gingeri TaxID=117681 RepID=UPI0015A23C30|nr:hypothetical protein [Pseudomonas gingeri]NWA11916.1 hypothetical protein [Pseudomonas gingeri]